MVADIGAHSSWQLLYCNLTLSSSLIIFNFNLLNATQINFLVVKISCLQELFFANNTII